MRPVKFATTCVVLSLLGACSNVPAGTVGHSPELPPIGLAASAVWLEERQSDFVPRPRAAADIPTSQIRSTVNGRAAPAPTLIGQPVPDRAAPTGTLALGVQAFTDTCVAALPSMNDVVSRFEAVSVRDFGVRVSEAGRNYYLSGQRPGDISMSVATGASRSNIKQCLISIRGGDTALNAKTLVDTVTNAGFGLTEVAPTNATQAWAISGAPAGTQLKVNSRRNFLGQQLTGVWITWR